MSSASVKINQAASPEPSDNVKGDSTETTITIQPVGLHVKNLVIGLTGNLQCSGLSAYRSIDVTVSAGICFSGFSSVTHEKIVFENPDLGTLTLMCRTVC